MLRLFKIEQLIQVLLNRNKMPASLINLKLRGVRSYSPHNHKTQSLEFMPLTLIVGRNGNGKTTIIESLKFIISGEEPPFSDSRRNFLHTSSKNSQSIDKNIAYATIELEFKNSRDETCLAKRDVFAPVAKASPAIVSAYRIQSRSWVDVHRQDDWSKTMPRLFNLPSEAMLNYVILCHQEDNLWCMSEPSNVKQVFEKIFGCEQYKKEIKYIDAQIKACKSEISLGERDVSHGKEKVARKKSLNNDLKTMQLDIDRITTETKTLDSEIKSLEHCMEELEKLEQMLLQRKCEQSELEDDLSRKQQELSRSINNLEGAIQGLGQRILNKEKYLKTLNSQLTQSDPMAKDLMKLTSNLENMSFITHKMPQSELTNSLNNLIDESSKIVDGLVHKITKDGVMKLKDDIGREAKEIEESRKQLKKNQELKVTQTEQHSLIEAENVKARSASKDAHNELLRFKAENPEFKKSMDEKKRLLELRDKRARMGGSKAQIIYQVDKIKNEMKSYSQVDIKHAKTLGQVVCNKIVLGDLEKLKECFQQSISTFHNQMIVKINEVLRSRWRQIYQGSDIDSIELVDEQNTKFKDRKVSNYHLAMIKGGVRMKMREKGSAGQKALAAIILRMTLAELFVKDFAFIALDEPTANLDHANVKSLAKAISSHVKRRTNHGMNIQWIIITHDENFLKALDAECSPFYYRVQLDDEGCSKIIKLPYQEYQGGLDPLLST